MLRIKERYSHILEILKDVLKDFPFPHTRIKSFHLMLNTFAVKAVRVGGVFGLLTF